MTLAADDGDAERDGFGIVHRPEGENGRPRPPTTFVGLLWLAKPRLGDLLAAGKTHD